MAAELIGKISDWIVLHTPVQCSVCFRWLLRKNAVYKQITAGGTCPLCPECNRAIFKPFSPAQKN